MALILIVDDSPTEVHVMKKALERHGYRTAVAGDGEEGIRLARQMHGALGEGVQEGEVRQVCAAQLCVVIGDQSLAQPCVFHQPAARAAGQEQTDRRHFGTNRRINLPEAVQGLFSI